MENLLLPAETYTRLAQVARKQGLEPTALAEQIISRALENEPQPGPVHPGRQYRETWLAIVEYAANHNLNELLAYILDTLGDLVESPIGFYHFLEADQRTLTLQQWSTRTTAEFCRANGAGLHYDIDQAGVWTDCVHARKPVIHNDLAALPHRRGWPEGHAEVTRQLAAPVLRDNRVVALLGLGNKPTDYTPADAGLVGYLADVTWEIVQHKRAENKYQQLYANAAVGVGFISLDGQVLDINPRITEILGYTTAELQQINTRDTYANPADRDRFLETIARDGVVEHMEVQLKKRDGSPVWVSLSSRPVILEGREVLLTTVVDIHTQKIAEEVARRTQARWQSIAETPFDWLVIVDRAGTYQYVNRTAPGIKEEDLIHKATLYDFIAADQHATVRQAIEAVFTSGQSGYFETYCPLLKQWASNHIGPILDEAGAVESVSIMTRDITPRKESERQLSETRRVLEEAEGMAAMGSWDWNVQTHEVHLSAGLCRIYGLTPEQGPPPIDSFLDNVHPDDREALQAAINGAIAEEAPYSVEYRLSRHSDGAERWLRAEGSLYYDESGAPERLLASVQDITEQKQAERQLQHALRQLQLAIDTARLGLWRLDVAGGRLEWNEHQYEIYGITPEQFSETLDDWRARVYPDDIDYADSRLAKAFEGESVFDVAFRVVRPDGEVRHVNASGSPVFNDAGELIELIGINIDVTNIYRQSETLREREAFLQAIFDHSLNAIMVADDSGSYHFANHAAAEMFGHPVERLLAMNVADLRTPDGPNAAEQYRQYLLKGYEVGQFEFIHPDGQQRIAMYHAVRVDTDFHLSILADITAQKQAEAALRESEATLRHVANNAPGIVYQFTLDKDGQPAFPFMSEQCYQLFGISAEAIMADAGLLIEAVHPDDRERFEKAVAQSQQNLIPYSIEHRVISKSGDIVWLNARSTPTRTPDGGTLWTGIGVDVTERKQAEAALRESEERFRVTFENAGIGMSIGNLEDQVMQSNLALQQILGYSKAELAARNPHHVTHPDDIGADVALYKELMDGRRDSYQIEKRYLHKSGAIVWANLTVSAVRGAGNTPRFVVAMVEDITRRKELEAQHLRQERLAAVGQLAAGIAHDFNNILSPIIGFAEVLQYQTDLSPESREKLDWIVVQGQRAATLIRQILDFTRQTVNDPKPLDLQLFLKESASFIERTIPETIKIQFNFTSDETTIYADPAKMQQVITNLAVNARDAMPRGGTLTFELSREAPPADAALPCLQPEGDPRSWVRLAVSDNGAGIDPRVLPHIFEPFFTTKEAGQGTGLGLAQIYGIVEQHNGCISVDSRPGQGSTFNLYFPALAPEAPARGPVAAELPMGQGQTILLVEDNPAVMEVTTAMLGMLNYQVLTALDGKSALELFQRRPDDIQVVLTDVVMPGMDGFALAEALAAIRPTLPVLLMSGYTGDSDLPPQLSDATVTRLHKPLNLLQLATALRTALGNK
jgi:two-component system cell cycle sensor histidine kinase/response regulator CckA